MNIRRMVIGGALAATLASGIAVSPASAAGFERDPERYSSAGTAWGFLVTDQGGIDTWLNQFHGRAVGVERWGSGFSVTAVDNKNPAFTRSPGGSFSWTADETVASLASKLGASPGKRLLDLERYSVNGETRFAATWVDNVGVAAKGWSWWLGLTPSEIDAKLQGCGACRLADFDPIGGGRYDVIIVPNTGVDGMTWYWLFGVTELGAFQFLADHHARPVNLEPDGTGRFAMLAVADGLTGSMRTNQTWAQVTAGPPAGQRYVDLKNYTNAAGQSVWLTVYTQNG